MPNIRSQQDNAPVMTVAVNRIVPNSEFKLHGHKVHAKGAIHTTQRVQSKIYGNGIGRGFISTNDKGNLVGWHKP